MIKTIKEHTALIVAVALFFIAPRVLRWIDPTSAAYDPGILHTIFVVFIAFSAYQWATWSITKTLWPDIGQYFKSGIFGNDFKSLPAKYKVPIALALYFTILASLVLLTVAVL